MLPGSVSLQPWQTVRLFGISPQMKRTVHWGDILRLHDVNFKFLYDHVQLPLDTLHILQPDGAEWVRASRVDLDDAFVMAGIWDMHPFRIFNCSIKDFLQQEIPCTLCACTCKVDTLAIDMRVSVQ